MAGDAAFFTRRSTTAGPLLEFFAFLGKISSETVDKNVETIYNVYVITCVPHGFVILKKFSKP